MKKNQRLEGWSKKKRRAVPSLPGARSCADSQQPGAAQCQSAAKGSLAIEACQRLPKTSNMLEGDEPYKHLEETTYQLVANCCCPPA